MSIDTVGTLRKVTLDGVTFRTSADADISQVRGRYTNEAVATSGPTMKKQTARVEEATGVDLVTNAAEYEVLKDLANRTKDFPMSYTTAAGDVYRATGFINLDKRQTQDGKTTISLLPRQEWEAFIAG